MIQNRSQLFLFLLLFFSCLRFSTAEFNNIMSGADTESLKIMAHIKTLSPDKAESIRQSIKQCMQEQLNKQVLGIADTKPANNCYKTALTGIKLAKNNSAEPNSIQHESDNHCLGDCINGQGTLTYSDGTLYQGSFKNHKKHGQGTITTPNGNKYSGEWQNDIKQGQGNLILSDGKKYIGQFKAGKYDGQGELSYPDGKKEIGLFKNGKFSPPVINTENQIPDTPNNKLAIAEPEKSSNPVPEINHNPETVSITQSTPQPVADKIEPAATNIKLTEQSIKNAEFADALPEDTADGFSKPDLSCKGRFNNGTAQVCETDYELVKIAFGDLNADGNGDATAIISALPIGANHPSQTLAFYLNHNGQPHYLGSRIFAAAYNHASIEALTMHDASVYLDILARKDTDPFCCPSLKLTESYQLQGKKLILLNQQGNSKPAAVPAISNTQTQKLDLPSNNQSSNHYAIDQLESFMSSMLGEILGPALIGILLGAFFSDKARPIRKWLGLLIIGGALTWGFIYNDAVRVAGSFIISFILTKYFLSYRNGKKDRVTIYGSAEWATLEYLQNSDKISESGLFLGDFYQYGQHLSLNYAGDRHLLTVAPTRSGKGVSAIIPNLLSYQGSMLVIDPKGENADITALYRKTTLGQTIHVVDPWGITNKQTGISSCFNPLDWLKPGDEDIGENALMLADSIITPPENGAGDPFWLEEAKALLMGIILYVALDQREAQQRHLARVRDIIVSDDPTFKAILQQMFENQDHPVIRSTAARTASKDQKLRASVIAALQAQTHFLDSGRIRESLSRSDFKFEDLKTAKITIYLVLPADRLDTFGRWLRLLVQQAITVNARNIQQKPDKPIIFLLDEMPALGRLTMVEQAYGLMAGFGMQLWGIVQDLSQLERIYDTGWETFIGNSGVIQYFGSRDHKTAEYFSKLCGVTTVEKVSFGSSISKGFSSAFGSSSSESSGGSGGGSQTTGLSYTGTTSSNTTETVNSDYIQRHLAYADELMVLHKERQLVFIENLNPIDAVKVKWHDDQRFMNRGVNLRQP